MRFGLLGSGSSGNAVLVVSASGKVLIDNGFSLKRLQERAAVTKETLHDLKAIFVTHEHADHVNGLGVLARHFPVPVFMTRGTFEGLPPSVGRLPRVEFFEAGDEVVLDGLRVQSYSVSHDAADPVSYVVRSDGVKLGIAADLGHVSQLVRNRLSGSHALVLESNYCPTLLTNGSYPPAVQQRIRGKHGHLSNGDMCSLLADLVHDALRIVVLVHLSEENNTRRLAYEMASQVVRDHPARVFIARQDRATRMFEVGA